MALKFSGFPIASNTSEKEFEVGIKGPSNYRRANNKTATTDPTVSSDFSAGYRVGSEWLNSTLGRLWRCKDSTAGAAVWILVSDDKGFQSLTVTNASTTTINTIAGFVTASVSGSVTDCTVNLPSSAYAGKPVVFTIFGSIANSITFQAPSGGSAFILGPVTSYLTLTFVCIDPVANTWNYTGYSAG